MIINSSRAQVAMKCWRDCFNRFHRKLEGPRSVNLVDGGALHDGIAAGLASKDWQVGKNAARARFDREKHTVTLLPEEQYLLDDHWDLIETMLEVFRSGYEGETYEVLQPECQFDVVLPGTTHRCVFIHWYDLEEGVVKHGTPPPEKILGKHVERCPGYGGYCNGECRVPHRLVGKTDAVVSWKGNIWLLEHKTSAIKGAQFWDQFLLDIQPTTYIYGIWKSLGLRPRGFVVNGIFKPSEYQVAAWNKRRKYGSATGVKDYIEYERQAFLRTEEDLQRVEAQYIDLCDEWEERIVNGRFPMSNIRGNCLAYNRLCDFHHACMSHEQDGSLSSLATRAQDYVDDKLVKICTT